jgi:hypothetical protein
MNVMQHTPIIVLVMLALGIVAVKIYKPDGAVRANPVRGSTIPHMLPPAVLRFTRVLAQPVV